MNTCQHAAARHVRAVQTIVRRSLLLLAILTGLPGHDALRAQSPKPTPSPKPAPEAPLSLLRQIDAGFVELFEQVAPTVVVIEATRKVSEEDEDDRRLELLLRDRPDSDGDGAGEVEPEPDDPSLPHRTVRSEGSGFFVRKDGHVVTNLHVVEDAEALIVRTRDGRRHSAKIVGSDDQTDIAVLKINATAQAVAGFGDSDSTRVGQLVCAIGAPFNQHYSFTCGWVSGTGRTNLLGATSDKLLLEDYIQTDAFINPGNSGGPLFDVDGRIIGMNTLINGLGRGLAFAIPSNLVANVVDQIVTEGRVRRSWLGIRMGAVAESGEVKGKIPDIDSGVVVYTIVANSPAYRSDLRPHDIITAVGGRKVSLPRDVQREIFRTKVGTVVDIEVWRDGKTVIVPVTTNELPSNARKLAAAAPRPQPSGAAGVTAGLTLEDTESGECRVAAVFPGSPAAAADFAEGDIITAVEAESRKGAAAVKKALKNAFEKGGEKGVLVNFSRDGKKSWSVIERPSK